LGGEIVIVISLSRGGGRGKRTFPFLGKEKGGVFAIFLLKGKKSVGEKKKSRDRYLTPGPRGGGKKGGSIFKKERHSERVPC